MPQKIYLIRHGETDHNKNRIFQGWLDVPLNNTGHTQAQMLAHTLSSHSFDVLYSSDLARAHQTATYISAAHSLPLNLTPALRERDMGVFAGWAWESEPDPVREKLWAEFELARKKPDLDWNGHQGESLKQVDIRLTTFVKQLRLSHVNQSVALISHGGTINRLLEQFGVKNPAEGYRMVGNTAVILLTKHESRYSLEVL